MWQISLSYSMEDLLLIHLQLETEAYHCSVTVFIRSASLVIYWPASGGIWDQNQKRSYGRTLLVVSLTASRGLCSEANLQDMTFTIWPTVVATYLKTKHFDVLIRGEADTWKSDFYSGRLLLCFKPSVWFSPACYCYPSPVSVGDRVFSTVKCMYY